MLIIRTWLDQRLKNDNVVTKKPWKFLLPGLCAFILINAAYNAAFFKIRQRPYQTRHSDAVRLDPVHPKWSDHDQKEWHPSL